MKTKLVGKLLLTAAILFSANVLTAARAGGKEQNQSAKAPPSGMTCPIPPPPPSDTQCYIGSGCLDVDFGSDHNGLVATYLNNYQSNNFRKLLTQPDGKIIGVGQTNNTASGTSLDFLVARYNADGTLDTSFGDFDSTTMLRRGYTTTTFSAGQDQDRAESAVLQPDGKIIVGGYAGVIGSWAIIYVNQE